MGTIGVIRGNKESFAVVMFADRAKMLAPAHFAVIEIHDGVGLTDHHRFCVGERVNELIEFVREIGMFAYDIVPPHSEDFDPLTHGGHYFMARRDWFQSGIHVLILSQDVYTVNRARAVEKAGTAR